MISFDWRIADKAGSGVIEEIYGLSGYSTLISDEISGLDSQIADANLPREAFERVKVSSPFEVKNVRKKGGDLETLPQIDLGERLKRRHLPIWRTLIRRVTRRIHEGFVRRRLNKVAESKFKDRPDFFVTTRREFRRHSILKRRRTSRTYLSGDENIPRRSGLRVSQINWRNRSLQRLLAFEIANFKDPLIQVDSLAEEDVKLIAASPRGYRLSASCGCEGRTKFAVTKRMETPLVSVVIVSYNQREFLESSILSVLNQDHPRVELIVVDGASTDGSVEVLKKYKKHFTKLIIEKDKGQSDALNKGFALSRGDVCNWLCSDDLLVPGALSAIAAGWSESGADIVVGGCKIVDQTGKILRLHHCGFSLLEVNPLSFGDLISFHSVWQERHYFNQPEVFFSREIWQRSGGFIRDDLFYAMDYELYLRFALASATIYHIPEFIGCSRIHKSQKTRHRNPVYLPTVRKIVSDYGSLFETVKKRAEVQYAET